MRSAEKSQLICNNLERVEIPHDILQPLQLIPQGAIRDPLSYRLHPNCGPERQPRVW